MSPLRGEEFTGRSVEEAIERGLRSIGKKRTDVDIEILEKGKPANVLGIGGEDARVLLTFQEEEAVQEAEPVVDEAEVPRRPDALRERDEESEDAASPALAEELAAGAGVLKDLLALMGVEAEVALDDRPRHEGVEVLGPDLGALIGRGAQNPVALQQITSAIPSRRVGRTVHIPVDIEGYRRRREDQLREMATRVASRVRATGQAVTLEPMLAYERRIVHPAVQGQAGLQTGAVRPEAEPPGGGSSAPPRGRGPVRPPVRPRPRVVRRMGGSTTDVAIVVAGPFIGSLCSPLFAYLLAHLPPVRVVAGTSALARVVFLLSILAAATPFMLAVTSVAFWVITIANISAYTALMQGIYPDRERAFAMGKVRVGASVAGIVAAALAGGLIDVVPAQWVFAAAALVSLPGSIAFLLVRYDGPPAPARPSARAIASTVWGAERSRYPLPHVH